MQKNMHIFFLHRIRHKDYGSRLQEKAVSVVRKMINSPAFMGAPPPAPPASPSPPCRHVLHAPLKYEVAALPTVVKCTDCVSLWIKVST